MKTLTKILPFVLLVACTPSDEAIKKKIILQKEKIAKTEQKIAKLEKQLSDTTETKRLVPVGIKTMKPEEFNHYIIVYGNVDAEKFANISPEMNGRIENIYVKEGTRASKGQLLLSLNTDAIDKQIQGVRSSLDLARDAFKKQDTLWKQGIGSEMQYLTSKNNVETLEAQLETLEAQLRMSQIRAPFDGIVDKIYPKKGEIAGPGFPVVEFVNLGSLVIKADVPENYIRDVKKGQQVELTFSSLPDFSVETPIVRVSEMIDAKSRTFEIELRIMNHNELIKPNMVSTIRINDFSTPNAFVVPSLVIRKDISGDFVYLTKVKDDDILAEKRYVKTSLSYNDETMITDGLKEGDNVIVAGFHLVSSGLPVKIID